MRIKVFKIFAVCLIAISLGPATCWGTQQAGAFLEIGTDARAIGMGGAFSALADNAFASHWNPAGISLAKRREAGIMYASLFGVSKFHCFSLVQPLGKDAGISVSWKRFSTDRIPEYPPFPEDLKTPKQRMEFTMRGANRYFSDTEDAVFFSFGKLNRLQFDLGWLYFVLPVEIPFGVNLKWIHQSVGHYSAQAVGFDLGTMMRFNINDLFGTEFGGDFSFGLVFQDVANTIVVWSTRHSDVIAHSIRWGIAYQQPLPGRESQAIVALDRDKQGFRVGLEYQFKRQMAVRMGFNHNSLCAGAGFGYRLFRVDYAFVNQALGPVHRLSGTVRF